MTNAPAQAPVPPQRIMSQLLFGKQLTASLSALARLGVADHLGDTAISADEIAGKVGAHAPSLFRVLVRAELPPHGRVLVCEQVMPAEPGPAPAKMLDIEMLVMTAGGKERTPKEFGELFASAGLKLGRVVTTPTPTFVIEALPA
jgi:hypothetical protein